MAQKTLLFLLLFPLLGQAQTNLLVTNPEAEAVLLGNFDPADYAAPLVIDDPAEMAQGLLDDISPDSLRAYLEQMSAFTNRNTGSDTTSATFGIGAARRWAYDKFQSFSAQNDDRLVVSYFQFDQFICGMGQHRNIFAVLPGQGPQHQEVLLVEAHIDSRCEGNCDLTCMAHGMEDNGSGTALVLELARIMSKYSFNRSVVFLITIGEEQGLYGANAFADYCLSQGVRLNAVLNNDVIGGVICGETASPPGCPGLNHIDSVNVRIYSSGTSNSKHKQLARFIKLEYQEMLQSLMAVQPVVNIMTPEDRTGRGGDHMPFRENGFPAIRFTSANEHGNGNPSTPGYSDRQHTQDDVLGLDTDGDGALDSFFVDFNYLSRNALLNGNALAMAAHGPVTPADFSIEPVNNGFVVNFSDSLNYGLYRVAVRLNTINDWDTLIAITQPGDTVFALPAGVPYNVSVASVDENGVESLFSGEKVVNFTTGAYEAERPRHILELLQNHPNPFDEATVIGVYVQSPLVYRDAFIAVFDKLGHELARLPIRLVPGLNDVIYDYQYHRYIPGTYAYSLVVDGEVVDTKWMIYAY